MKVALVGSGEQRLLAPFADKEWQIWLYEPDLELPRITLRFTVPHFYKLYDGSKGFIFPAKQLLEDFGDLWFTSAPAWLIPFALIAGAKEIAIYGAELSELQCRAIHHWFWVCEQLRVNAGVPAGSDLLKVPEVYGL